MRRFLVPVLALFSSLTLCAGEITPDLFSNLKWRLVGPFRGGRAVAVSGVPGDGATFYFGAVNGGVWKTTDAGVVWSPIFDDQPVASIGALAVAPSNPNIIYAGTGESDIRSDLASGDGMYKSTDGGKSWHNIGLKETRQISRIAVSPKDPDAVLVAALGHAYGPNEERGVFLSADGGESWRKVLDRGPAVGAADIAMAVDEPNIVFAAMWEAHRPPWSTYAPIGGPAGGLFRSRDGGKSWSQLNGHGLPAEPWGRAGVAVARGTGGKRIYVSIDAKEAGIYRSDDGGDTWILANKDSRLTSRAWYFSSITADPDDPDVLYVPNVALYKLSDAGKTLSIVRGAPGGDDYHQLWIDPMSSSRMVLATDQGTTVSLNGGATWSSWYNQPTAQFYHVVTDNEHPYHVYGAQQDSGTAATTSRSDRGQIDGRDWFTVGGSESGYIAPDPQDPDIFYVSGTYGTVDRFDRRTMQSQNIAPWPMPGGLAETIAQRKYRDPWTPVLVFPQRAPYSLYLGTQYVMRTGDGGLHWQKISPDLTGAQGDPLNDTHENPVTFENAKERNFGVVYSIAPSPLNASEIWAGSDTGLVHVTRDGGRSWTDVTPKGISAWSKITHIEASHFTPGAAYVAVDRHRLDDQKPYLFRTRDFGKNWTPITAGISGHAFLNCIREDPKRKGLLFAGTELGAYVSLDDGEKWLPIQLNLPVTSVRDLAIHENDLIAATHGRSFWILDDISPLRQMNSSNLEEDLTLFKPARALRLKSDAFLGTPLPPEEPQAANPPDGAVIDYRIRNAADELTLDIADQGGKVVRHFSSRENPGAPPKNMPIAPRWLAKKEVLSAQPGVHRFVWDLRYGRSGVNDAGDNDADEEQRWVGPLVLPGTYHVRLGAGQHSAETIVQVGMDPRSHATSAELATQFQWAQRIFTDMISARTAVAEIQGLQSKLDEINPTSGANADALSGPVTALRTRTDAILTGKTEDQNRGLSYVSRAISVALNAVENADRTPPSQVIALYQELVPRLRANLAAWSSMKKTELPGLNQELQNRGLQPIAIADLEENAQESLAK